MKHNPYYILSKRILSTLLLLLCGVIWLTAQISTTQYGLSDGLPSSETYFGYQDDSNYLWFTTDRGLVKYDGYEFKTFTTADGLLELVNFKITEDPRGGFILQGKNSKFTHYIDGKFKEFKFNQELEILNDSLISRLEILDITTNYILFRKVKQNSEFVMELNRATGEITTHPIHNAQVAKTLNFRKIDLNAFRKASHYKIIYNIDNTSTPTYFSRLDSAFTLYLIKHDTIETIDLPFNCHFAMVDSRGYIWYAVEGNVYYTSSRNVDISKSIKVSNQEISSIFEDHEGNIWLCLATNGIIKISINDFLKKINIPYFSNRVVDIYYTPPFLKFYTAESKNAYKFYIINDTVYSLPHTTKYILDSYEVIDSLPLGNEFSFDYIDAKYKLVSPYFQTKFLLNLFQIGNYIVYERSGTLNVYDKLNKTNKQLSLPYIYDFTKYDSSTLLAGTPHGLYEIYFCDSLGYSINFTGQINNRINDIDLDNNGFAWIATLQKGLYSYKNGTIKKIINPYHEISAINTLEGLDTVAFVGTSHGINRLGFTRTNDSIIVKSSYILGRSGGLSTPYIKSIEYYNNKIYLGTLIGLYIFRPDSFYIDKQEPTINIKGVFYQGRKLTSEKEKTKIKYNEDYFTIKYLGISYSKEPLIPFYRYMIYSEDSTLWRYTNSREITFSDLIPGDYTFTVQCRNNANIWSNPATIQFSIAPHFTQTWTFRLGSIIFLLTGIGVFYYIRNKRLKRQQALKNEILNVKMQSTRSQMNPHFVFNGMNAIQNFIFTDEKEAANKYITTFSSLLRDSLIMSEMDYISLDREVRFIDRYLQLEKNRFPEKFNYEIVTHSTEPIEKVLVPTLMVQTLAENAVKHAFKGLDESGLVLIKYEYQSEKNLLKVTIEDNGIGLKNQYPDIIDTKDNQFGLNLLKRRIDIYNERSNRKSKATMQIDYRDPIKRSGTVITLNIPLNGNNN